MSKTTLVRGLLTAVMVAYIMLLPLTGYEAGSITPVWNHFAYMWSHANIWHLLGNLFVLWMWRGDMYILPSILIAFLCSFLPTFGIWPIWMTVGFSGVLFAMHGIRWGQYCRHEPSRKKAYAEFGKKALPLALIGIIIPHINWCIHLYCILAGFVYGRYHR